MKISTIESANAGNARINFMAAVFFWVAAVAMTWWMHSSYDIPLTFDVTDREFCPLIFVPVIFVFIGISLAIRALIDWLRVRKYGLTTLEADEVFLGGALVGTIRTVSDLEPLDDYTINLRCIETVARGSASNNSVKYYDERRWEGFNTVKRDQVRSSQGIPVKIAIPAGSGAMATVPGSEMRAGTGVRWTLEIRAPLKGLDYYAIFLIIVGEGPSS